MTSEQRKKMEKKAASRGLGAIERHVLLCAQSGCCKDKDEAKATGKTLNKALKQLKTDGITVYASQVDCLKLCQNGPLMVVYPEGVWYGRVTPEACERIIQKHLREGEIVEELAFARSDLGNKKQGAENQVAE